MRLTSLGDRDPCTRLVSRQSREVQVLRTRILRCKIYVAMARPLLWSTRALADSWKLDKQRILPKKVLRLLTKLRLSKRPI